MLIGMSRDEFWNGDCEAVIDYRKADELRQKRKSEDDWVLGAYIFDLLLRLSPIPVVMTDSRNVKREYMDKPYWKEDKKLLNPEEQEKMAKASAEAFRIMALNANKKFKGRGQADG